MPTETWVTEATENYERRLEEYQRRQPKVLLALIQNLNRYMACIEAGAAPQTLKFGWLHKEKGPIKAVDQDKKPTWKIAGNQIVLLSGHKV